MREKNKQNTQLNLRSKNIKHTEKCIAPLQDDDQNGPKLQPSHSLDESPIDGSLVKDECLSQEIPHELESIQVKEKFELTQECDSVREQQETDQVQSSQLPEDTGGTSFCNGNSRNSSPTQSGHLGGRTTPCEDDASLCCVQSSTPCGVSFKLECKSVPKDSSVSETDKDAVVSPILERSQNLSVLEETETGTVQRERQDSETTTMTDTSDDDFSTDNLLEELTFLNKSSEMPLASYFSSLITPKKTRRSLSPGAGSSKTQSCGKQSKQKKIKGGLGFSKKRRRSLSRTPRKKKCKRYTSPEKKRGQCADESLKASPRHIADAADDKPLSVNFRENRSRRGSRESTPKKTESSLLVSSIPADIMEIIIKSSVDDALSKKAEQRRLTATHVKSIIRNIIKNEGVVDMVRSMFGKETATSYEPKLTRARKKELLEKHMIDSSVTEEQWMSGSGPPSVNPPSCSETQALVLAEFPEEEDDEEYSPEADEQLVSDDETNTSGIVSPCTSPSIASDSATKLKPSSALSTPLESYVFKRPRVDCVGIQRQLDFSMPPPDEPDATELISNRTRSKCPLMHTQLEELEMAFRPPDITLDMYEMECEDEDWKKFLLEFVQPPKNDPPEDDEVCDPEYNILKDFEREVKNKHNLQEEMRKDKAVEITKKEFNQLMSEFLDGFDYGDDSDREQQQRNAYSSNTTKSNQEVKIKITTHGKDAAVADMFQSDTIVVEFLVAIFTPQQLEVLRCQLVQHIQLLTTTAVLYQNHPVYHDVAVGCENMLATI